MIRAADYRETVEIYKKYMRKDFPINERRPLYMVKRLHKSGAYTCLVLEEGGQLLAYAFLLGQPSGGAVLLDYFAVAESQRGTGIGSRFLGEISSFLAADGIIIECETPADACKDADRLVRERRIAFYIKNGAEMTDIKWRLFGVKYNILWLPIQCAAEKVELREALVEIYKSTLTPAQCRRNTHIE